MEKRNVNTDEIINSIDVINKSKERICNLELNIKRIEQIDNKILAIVELFKFISPIQDQGGFTDTISNLDCLSDESFTGPLEAFKALNWHINNCGRDIYDKNRTKKDEEVTANKIYLGNFCGISECTADYLLKNEEELRLKTHKFFRDNLGNPGSTWYLINDRQCGQMIANEVKGILKNIQVIKKFF